VDFLYIGFVSGKILRKKMLAIFYNIFCGGKKYLIGFSNENSTGMMPM
jgi:hypothetical protein